MLPGLVLSSSVLLLASPSLVSPAPGPLPIVGGTDATTCEWPSTVALNSGDTTYCSGTLIHPQVILTAAHCLHPANGWGDPTSIAFGEQGSAPAFSVGIQGCGSHPEYDHDAQLHSPEDAHDLAYCVLDQPVLDVALTPPLMGCEVDQLDLGDTMQIVGYGASSITPDGGGGFDLGGGGTKRYIAQTIDQIDGLDQIYLVGMGGSACSGDSGGSAYFQLDDGSWRVAGAAARIHPDAPQQPPYCTYGVIYTGIWNEMAWFESETGFDLTPCHDTDGTWNPGPECTGFPLDPQGAAGWADGCAAQGLSGEGASCAPDPPPGTTGDSGDTGDTDDTTSTTDDTGPAGSGTGPAGSTDGATGTPLDGDGSTGLPGGTGESTGAPAAGDDGGGEGCGCTTSSSPGRGGATGLLLLLLGWRRRSRRPT